LDLNVSGAIAFWVHQDPRNGLIIENETIYFLSAQCGIGSIVMADPSDFFAHKLSQVTDGWIRLLIGVWHAFSFLV
jgi:hypothetical protein